MAVGPLKEGALRDHLLVLRCQAGDEDAFLTLYHRFGPRTKRYLAGLVGEADAEDAQQEVWMTVYRRVAGLANPGAFRTWLFQLTRNRGLDQLRRRSRQEQVASLATAADPPAQSAAEPAAAVLDRAEVDAAMASLSPAHQEVMTLFYWEDMTYQEIALVTSEPVGTVRSRLHHARAQVRRVLQAMDC